MTIIDVLNARIERGQASDRAVAEAAGITVGELDRDTTEPDRPREIGFELRDNGRRVELFDRNTQDTLLMLTTEQAWEFYHWWGQDEE